MADEKVLDCPSAPHQHPEAKLIGVVLEEDDGKGGAEARVSYLEKDVALPEDFDPESLGVDPGHALRFSAPCANNGCGQWRDGGCGLGKAIIEQMQPVVDVAPACTLRATCRWFAENGTASCVRCPQITTRRHRSQPIHVPRSPVGPVRPEKVPSPAHDPDGGATVRI
ncbi:hypothetical protein [Alteriqipengyuania lutimaris]|nr:hypothetical protein [Alteriqipengyuania lutimaris]MBB3034103.1 hypothetical protein [Alteriqipengyuania lutimaris]